MASLLIVTCRIMGISANFLRMKIFLFPFNSKVSLNTQLRLFPDLRHIKISDVDTDRMQIRVRQGKEKKDRYVILSRFIAAHLPHYLQEVKPWSVSPTKITVAFVLFSFISVFHKLYQFPLLFLFTFTKSTKPAKFCGFGFRF